MAPPTFADLGKSAKDLFNKGYNHGFLKVDSTTKAGDSKEVEFKTSASHNLGSGKLGGNLDVKYKIPAYGEFLVIEEMSFSDLMVSSLRTEQKSF
ncbi:hypothetical protein ANCCAN_18636 [Ancylostoma caninum]|uniref:Uncharacterized protein n=1 Tax=Ancylostoma caninum TaxID=29170 RepID=A0A368FTS5_ANCCA|nr:hypothetical protein ANCCAN_18636 [Ancylostoma caninum]